MPTKYATQPPPAGAVYATPSQAAHLSQTCYETLRRAHRRGAAVGLVKLGRATRFHIETLRRWLDAQAVASA